LDTSESDRQSNRRRFLSASPTSRSALDSLCLSSSPLFKKNTSNKRKSIQDL
jgi:hypothetical protein